jgi:3-oxoacyl-[acyl-carrier protein] reductase
MKLQGKTAVVSGGNRGIGKAIVQRLAEEGAQVIFLGTNAKRNKKVEAEWQGEYGTRIQGTVLDVRDESAVTSWWKRVELEYGPIDILVNNAGICHLTQSFTELSDQAWQETLAVNLYGSIHLLRGAIPLLQKTGGKIVNIASLAGEVGGIATAADYVASKAAIIGLTKSLARELGPDGINVNAVAPGFVRTQMTEKMKINLDSIPLRRIAEPEDIASAVLFLASEESRCITGATLDVNGGLYLK